MREPKAGAKVWTIPDCYLPARSSGELESHESTCVLNLGSRPAAIKLTAYFEDRDPLEGFGAKCPPRRTMHIRLNGLKNQLNQSLPLGVPFALKVESNQRVIVQHTRLDATQPALALMTTMAFAVK